MTTEALRGVTFLFTDIEGSTRRWEADPRCGQPWLQHDEVLRSAIEAHGGLVQAPWRRGVGNSSPRPLAAVDAAQPNGTELPVRTGISTGEAELVGRNYFGPVLNRAARVMAAGQWRSGTAYRLDRRALLASI